MALLNLNHSDVDLRRCKKNFPMSHLVSSTNFFYEGLMSPFLLFPSFLLLRLAPCACKNSLASSRTPYDIAEVRKEEEEEASYLGWSQALPPFPSSYRLLLLLST